MEETKVCSKCGVEKPLTDEYFNRRKESKDGFRSNCKDCRYKIIEKPVPKEGMKICTKCSGEFPATTEYFRKSNVVKCGLKSECIKCDKEKQKENYFKNKEVKNEQNRKYKKEHKEEMKEYSKKWQEEHKEQYEKRSKQYSKQYYKEHKEEIIKRVRKYEKDNRKKVNKTKIISTNRRRTKKKQLQATLTKEQWEQIKKDFDYKCCYCGKELPLEQEHFLALSKMGEFTTDNILPACRSCNSSKRDSDFFTWYQNYMHYSKKREKKILEYLNYTDKGEQQLTIAL